jgi:hypothetical protein
MGLQSPFAFLLRGASGFERAAAPDARQGERYRKNNAA